MSLNVAEALVGWEVYLAALTAKPFSVFMIT